MGRKGKWFGVVKKVFSPEPKEKKAHGQKTEKLKSIEACTASTSESCIRSSGAPRPAPVVDVPEKMVEQQQSEVIPQVATIGAGDDTIEVTVDMVDPTPTISKFNGKPKEEVAAIMIQTAFRGYQARRGLRALKGLVRLKSLVDGDAAKRQVTTTLRCMQTLSRVQSQIQSRRIRLVEEKQVLQRLRREQELEALKLSMGDEWDDSLQTKEQVDASLMSKHGAALRRERAMAYSFTHQRKNTLKSGYPLFTDLNNPNWQWSCLERLATSKPRDNTTPTEKEPPSNDQQASSKSTVPSIGVEITNAYARRDTNTEKQSIGTQKSSRHAVRHASITATPKALSVAKSSKSEAPQKGTQMNSKDDDSKNMVSDANQQHTHHGSTTRDDETHVNHSNTTPNFMTPTVSAKAKSRFNSPSNEVETPDKASSNLAKKRLSLSTADKHTMSSPARRHSGPPNVSISPAKVAHSDSAPYATVA